MPEGRLEEGELVQGSAAENSLRPSRWLTAQTAYTAAVQVQGEKGGYLQVRDLFTPGFGGFLISCAKVIYPFLSILPQYTGIINSAYYFNILG